MPSIILGQAKASNPPVSRQSYNQASIFTSQLQGDPAQLHMARWAIAREIDHARLDGSSEQSIDDQLHRGTSRRLFAILCQHNYQADQQTVAEAMGVRVSAIREYVRRLCLDLQRIERKFVAERVKTADRWVVKLRL